ncbi:MULTISPECIES: hypothetical protein [unclassified Francisella]|uniref:hypothetical protein n=1 Tax=unclassified Francisella TaxID=2610885 RepID=UPI002E34E2BD|nr:MULTISPECIES: hypothetical protein [unclassified Francisella]MED7819751.1 hypothetical protein [Francisella sp. 19S2-4]MED7830571.1 hypothetical protein [Francisella sp. 19S2-10]
MKKLVLTSMLLSASVSTIAYADTKSDKNDICPSDLKYKNINMKDMSFKYAKYNDHICATLKVNLDKNKSWKEQGSGWFAAGFGAQTMKDSNMFIFVPQKTDNKKVKYDVFANVGGAYGPTKPLDTKPTDGQIDLLSSSLGKVKFAIYPKKVANLADTGNIDMIFSHSKAATYQFIPPHVSAYDDKQMVIK